MNVALYLKLIDIPLFIQVNHKTMEACNGLKINPLNDDNMSLHRSLKFIKSCFPRPQTLYLTYDSFTAIFKYTNKYQIPNVKLFKCNWFVFLSDLVLSPVIRKGIDRAYIGNETISILNLYNIQSIKMDVSNLLITEKCIGKISSLKYLYLNNYSKDMNFLNDVSEQIIDLSNKIIVIYEENYWTNKVIQFEELKQLRKILGDRTFIKYPFYFETIAFHRISEIPKKKKKIMKVGYGLITLLKKVVLVK